MNINELGLYQVLLQLGTLNSNQLQGGKCDVNSLMISLLISLYSANLNTN